MDMTSRIFVTATILQFLWILFQILDADALPTVHTPTDLSVREGDTVTLVCTYEPWTEPVFFGSLSWQMGDTVLASYTCPNACSRTNANPDRYTLDVDLRFSGNLTISDITLEDANVYRCGVTTVRGVSDSHMRLVVNGPPDPPVITGIPDNLIENQQTSISCQADNGHPSPSFQWFIGNKNLSGDAILLVSTDINSRIDATSQLRYLPQREDNGFALQCNVIHDELSQPLKEMSDALTINYCPTTVEVTVCPEVEAGSSEVMVCRSGASNPASNLVWTTGVDVISKPSALQTHFEESSDPLGTRTTLSYMRNFTKDDYEQSFTCCTTVSLSCDFTVCSEPCIPNVIYPPTTPSISSNKPYGVIPEGTENLEILCSPGEGRPRPEVVWVFNDDPSHSLEQVSLGNGSQLLMFSEVSRTNAGMYRCIANNNVPPTSSADHQLVIEFPSTIRNKDDDAELALEGENVTFICEAEGKPSPSITWQQLRNQSDELDNGILVTQSEQRTAYRSLVTSTLIIAEVIPEMYNTTFSCVANNSYGTDRKNFYVKKPDLESRRKLAPALISVAVIVILLIIIFVIIRWRLSRKNKQAREQSQSPRGKNMHISDPSSSSVKEDKPYAELSNTGKKTQEHDYMPLNTYETMELADRPPPNKEDKHYAELSNTGMKTQELDYMLLNTYETPMELADRSPPGAPDSTLGGGVTGGTNLGHTYANAEERGFPEDSRENDYINNTLLIPRVI